jgi:hypothetical protein
MRQVPPWLVRGRVGDVAEVRLGLWDMVSIPARFGMERMAVSCGPCNQSTIRQSFKLILLSMQQSPE